MSGNRDLDVTSGELVGLSGKIDKFQQELNSRITSLNGVVDRIQAGWKGAAQQEYDRVQAELNRRLRDVQRDLDNLQQLVKMSADGFDAQETERIQAFRKMEPGQGSAILNV
ncbi:MULTISPECIES: WXG100 family type VII secretion target [Streptomyces]|uniref:WXG100 family type VII secretion target n=1 Tax=Streptomyces albipurpureus TaxID=2897419 RepID=A0ABT0UWP6_9ACTN|nr:WXG100 family type VII secretion target [Streptomyces sp. CWNU-1]MCM2392880.1 WXG100 family type VII secretion target [Streptomyces sp. CWNU-1]